MKQIFQNQNSDSIPRTSWADSDFMGGNGSVEKNA